jgi:hypothetical protein
MRALKWGPESAHCAAYACSPPCRERTTQNNQRFNRRQTTGDTELRMLQRTTDNAATDNMQRTRRNMQHCQGTENIATAHMQQSKRSRITENMQNCTRHRTTDATDNGQQAQHATCNMQHATCNMQHATCNMQQTTDVITIRYAAGNMQHTTSSDRQHVTMQQTHHGAKVSVNRAAGAAAGESRRRRASRAATAHLIKHSVLPTAIPTAALRTTPMPGESRVLGARICIRAGPPRCRGLRTPCSQPRRCLPAGLFARARAADVGRVQRSYGTGRNLLLSHPVPRQPRRRHAAEEGFSTKRSSPHQLTSCASPMDFCLLCFGG